MWVLVKSLAPALFSGITKQVRVNLFWLVMAAIFFILLWMRSGIQAKAIESLSVDLKQANAIAEQRMQVIDLLRSEIKEQQFIVNKTIENEQRIREHTDGKIETIRTLLKGNVCAKTVLDDDIIKQLYSRSHD